MVKVVVTGANSGLALEVIDALVEGKHEVLALVRRDPSSFPQQPGVTWAQTSFKDKDELVRLFRGADAVLNFIVLNSDPGNEVAIRVIDAVVEAGVPRYAPSEWAMGTKLKDIISAVPFYQGKLDVQKYLADLNKEKKVLEYSLFHVGFFFEYAAYPRALSKHVRPIATNWQLNDARLVSVKGYEHDKVTFTRVRDIARVVRGAVEYQGAWPVVGGIRGADISATEFKAAVEAKLAAGKGPGILPPGTRTLRVDLADEAVLAQGKLDLAMPKLMHPSIPDDLRDQWHAPVWSGSLLATARGAWNASDEWNQLLPDIKMSTVDDFIEAILANE
ncbi:hypothetical protein SPBR_05111 [Sporothrix brasiliensis 5110]|uniref:NmrA-like domain-containing protein n=1 Tax=Sporothrix brasiliensis 5110 TaxID=1398154 RepID=A0A0C2IS94_9PEZI|nr:uncharacterized protein SPBR_05111 [Sporothrix brasiliensis 5110]KIH87877.1 hypothetical protein SPBR_05111 [Sporothrix brasiliensis 5110]